MTPEETLRADAARNRELVLEAASQLFAEHGLDVSMGDIAARAGVGVGTVFRRFASKDELVATLVAERVDELASLARSVDARSRTEPWAAFCEWFVGAVELHVRDRGFMEAMAASDAPSTASLPQAPGYRELVGWVQLLVIRAQESGELRDDFRVEDIPILQCAVSRTARHSMSACEPELWRRHCAIVLDGLRTNATNQRLSPDPVPFDVPCD